MKFIKIISTFVCMALVMISATSVFSEEWDGTGRYTELSSTEENIILLGETFFIISKSEIAQQNIKIEGETITFLGIHKTETKIVKVGFKAIKKGKAIIKINLNGSPQTFEIHVVSADEIPLIKIAEIIANPQQYRFKLFKIAGANRGWAPPMQHKEAWGERITKSDWVLEDETGAVNVTGQVISSAKNLIVISYLAPMNDNWVVWAVKLIEETPPPQYIEMKTDIKLKEGTINVMKVGQTATIGVYPSRSHIFVYEIEGDAVVAIGQNRDELYIKAVKSGEAKVKIYLKFWRDLGLEIPEGSEPQPQAVFVIKVK